jgi:hypothetical protein
MPIPNFIIGASAVAYTNTTPLLFDGAPSYQADIDAWLADGSTIVMGNIIDLSLEVESEFVDSTTRSEAAQGFASEVAVLKGGRLTFEARWKPGDAGFDVLKDAWLNSTEMPLVALDRGKEFNDPADGKSQGLAANWTVGFSKTENLRDIQKVSVTLAISSFPTWYVVPDAP